MQIGPIPIFFASETDPSAENRFRWKSRKSAGNLKNPLENKISQRKIQISSGTRNIPPEN
jgi:hypothetical protein